MAGPGYLRKAWIVHRQGGLHLPPSSRCVRSTRMSGSHRGSAAGSGRRRHRPSYPTHRRHTLTGRSARPKRRGILGVGGTVTRKTNLPPCRRRLRGDERICRPRREDRTCHRRFASEGGRGLGRVGQMTWGIMVDELGIGWSRWGLKVKRWAQPWAEEVAASQSLG